MRNAILFLVCLTQNTISPRVEKKHGRNILKIIVTYLYISIKAKKRNIIICKINEKKLRILRSNRENTYVICINNVPK